MSVRLGSLRFERAFEFFYTYAGYSYDPAKESRRDGKERCAEQLLNAELWARDQGYTFEWSVDDIDSSSWCDDQPTWPQWVCIMYTDGHKSVQSVGGVDFGRDSPEPWGQPYKRVIEAELALEQMT